MLKRGLDDFPRQGSRLTDAEATDSVTGKADFDSPLGRFLPQLAVHPTLHDAKEILRRPRKRRGGRPRPPGRAKLGSCVCGAGAPARVVLIMLADTGGLCLPPGRGVRGYVIFGPWDFFF